MDNSVREVLFWKFCPKCVHFKKEEYEVPCRYCLDVNVRYGTSKPTEFKPKSQKNQLL